MTTRSTAVWGGAALLLLAANASCGQIPGKREQHAKAGGAPTEVPIRALLEEEGDPLIAALLGHTPGGGELVGANVRWFEPGRSHVAARALQAELDAERNPTAPAEARAAGSADIDRDGFVTLDELIAMQHAG